MTDPLRPSKFGAGYTYSGSNPTTQPGPVPSVAPAAYPPPATFPPPASYPPPSPYAAATHPVSPPNYQIPPAAAPQFATGSPSGATAIIAAVLALLGGALRAFYSFGLIQGLYYLSQIPGDLGSYVDDSVFVRLVIYSVASVAATAALLLGGVLLLSRKRAGRALIVIGCILVIAEAVLTWVAAASFMQSLGMLGSGTLDGALNFGASTAVIAALSIGAPLLTTILALAPATARWCR
jgi:hypothetical protein